MVAAIAALLACGVAAAPAAAPGSPTNDAYLLSLELNRAGTKLDHTHTLVDTRDTTSATTQADIFDPCGQSRCPPGPSEHLTCAGTAYGHTIWYDFYPDTNGVVRIRTAGYPNVIALYTFSRRLLTPKVPPQRCAFDQFGAPSSELDANVKKGVAYTFQIGGIADNSGRIEMQFDFFAMPNRLTGDATITASGATGGLLINTVKVTTSSSATVSIACGGRCNPKPKSHSATESFNLGGVYMPTGAKLQIFITRSGFIGQLIQYTITPTGANKATFCLEPGSKKPRKTCH